MPTKRSKSRKRGKPQISVKTYLKPPKSGKKKLTKAQKDALKKEEEEQKLREEEEARLKAEEDAKEQQERDQLEAKERKLLEKEESARRKTQHAELNTILDAHRNILENQANERRRTAKWDRYMLCDGTPDPTIPGEINTYINLWRDDKSNDDIKNVLFKGKTLLALIKELEFLLEDTPEGDLTTAEINMYNQTITELQLLLGEKLDRASHIILLQATERADPETANLQRIEKDEFVTLCFWGNLSKNPRIKSYEFKDVNLQFEIPKLLTLTDCAYRVMVTQYDHLSYKCASFHPRPKQKAVEVPVLPEGGVGDGAEKKDEEKAEGEGEEPKEGEEQQPVLEEEKTEDLMASLYKKDDEEEEKPAEPEPEPEPEPEVEEEEVTPESEEWEDFDGDEDAVDLRAYSPVGGIIYFHLLQLPPQPKNVNSWVITQLPEKETLAYMPYLSDDINLELIKQKQKEAEDEAKGVKKDEEKKRDERPPIGITLTMPSNVYFCEEPQIARWDADNLIWRLDGFSQTTYDEATRVLKFNTSYFGPFVLSQDTHINMPFQSWELRPRDQNAAVLSIIAAIVEVEIEIKGGQCQLGKPDHPELEHLRNQWYSAADFIKAMKAAGINLFPNKDSSKYVSIQEKDSVAERRLYEQMALTASGMAYSWSKWNNEVASSEKIIIQGAESMKDEPLGDDQWSLFMITKKRTFKLKVTEFDDEFAEDYAEGTNFHADMYHMAEELMSEKGMQQIREADFQFYNAVYTMLKATRLVLYS